MAVNKITNLAQVLQKYYLHKGNRIIFSNKMTLNQLAIAMWERMGEKGMEASSLSRIVNGKRLFTQKQLEEFCNLLKIVGKDKFLLKNTLYQDYYSRFGLDMEPTMSPYFFDLVEDNINRIIKIRQRGDSKLALEWAHILYEKLLLARKEHIGTTTQNIINALLASLIYDMTSTYFELTQPEHALYIFRPLAKELIDLGNKLKSKKIISQGILTLGDAYYIAKNSTYSLSLLKRASQYFEKDDLKLRIFRIMLLNCSYMGLRDNFMFIKQLAEKELKNNFSFQTQQIAYFYEGLGRAQGILKFPDAYKSFEKTEKIHSIFRKKREISPFAETQLIRSKLEAISYLEPNNKNYLEEIGEKGLNMAKKYDYRRHAKKIKEILIKNLH